ncbi:CHAD domain-containing protein [Thiohalophilus sp.]|uniref:CHAD domain-containing protein n=1 Tax=Thiohalophilus sp. TaxID=3028392 RepID=UPI002ACD9332|nr:CHAD domain-containing protein [Thiohalophilus sp.]MDZ7803318.1 CHAD domain-containing protein [Thiohalophilus sp.]
MTNLLTINAEPIREWLDGGNLNDEKQIHQLRVCIKKLRSLLRLIRDLSDADIPVTKMGDTLKSMSQCLSGQRDYDVVCGILCAKAEEEEDVSHRESFILIQKLLGQAYQTTVPEPAQLRDSGQIVVTAIDELPSIELSKKKLAEYLSANARRICKKGHKALATAGCVQLHKLRKRVKTLFYQLTILSEAGFDIDLPTKKLKKLGNRLGKIHDYCVLENMLDELRNNDATSEKIQQADWQRVQKYSNAQRQQYLTQSSKLHRKWCRQQNRVAEKA